MLDALISAFRRMATDKKKKPGAKDKKGTSGKNAEDETKRVGPSVSVMLKLGHQGTYDMSLTTVAGLSARTSRCRHKLQTLPKKPPPVRESKALGGANAANNTAAVEPVRSTPLPLACAPCACLGTQL